ncbi:phosphotransferase family protein [Runella zeae]|uniref:phosphotransferase family protein n=1 Tax=Runella zeae TaxID=94255 RepID=UPI002356A10E|nr:aminoglycoside phosphotransferase family protein [Runella zeae]
MNYRVLLTGYNILGYLRNQSKESGISLIKFSSLNNSNFEVQENFSGKTRNNTLLVTCPDGAGNTCQYFIKQCPSWEESFYFTFNTERFFFDTFTTNPVEGAFLLPKRLCIDSSLLVTVFVFDNESKSLYNFLLQTASNKPRAFKFSQILAKNLRAWHQYFLQKDNDSVLAKFDKSIPFPLNIDNNLINVASYHGDENKKDFLAFLQESPDLIKSLGALRKSWLERPQTLLHGDLKPSNILISTSSSEAAPILTLIDWEMALVGDPLWDIASFVASLILMKFKPLMVVLIQQECDECIEQLLTHYFNNSISIYEKELIFKYAGAILLQHLWVNPSECTSDLFKQVADFLTLSL